MALVQSADTKKKGILDTITEFFKPEPTKPEQDPARMDSFGMYLRGLFFVNEGYRRPKELEWLQDLRQYKGLYDPEVKIAEGNSKVYPKLTRSKVNMVLSRLHEMLFPDKEKNWEISPSNDPRIDEETVIGIAKSLMAQDPKTGKPIPPSKDQLQDAVMKYCKQTCDKMNGVIDDQLEEMDYPQECKGVLRSGLQFGTGIFKGPMINRRSKRFWEPSTTKRGDFIENIKRENVPYFESVRIWDYYPDMSTTMPDKIDGQFERHIMTKHDLRDLIQREDFFPEAIKAYMEEHPDGDYVPKTWETNLQLIEIEAGAGKESTISGTVSQPYGSARKPGKKYEVLEYWGFVDGQDMAACGVMVDDITLEYEANIWLLGNHVIKANLYDRAVGMYKLFFYEKDDTSLFGEGLPRVMRHSQLAVSSGSRMVLDNGACVAGPQVECNYNLMMPGTDISDIYPRKIWFREGRGIEAQYPAIRSINFDSHIKDLFMIVDKFKQFADEETCLPTWLIAGTTSNETAQADSGRRSEITISIKDVVKNFDTFNEKVLRDMYAWNMEFNDRQDIKGDYQIKARGISSLVMREIRMQALREMKREMTPEDWLYVPRRDFLDAEFKAHSLDVPLRSEVEAQAMAKQAVDQKAKELQYEMMIAEVKYKNAQALAMITKSQDKAMDTKIKDKMSGLDEQHKEMDLHTKAADIASTVHGMNLEKNQHNLAAKDQQDQMDLENAKLEQEANLAQQQNYGGEA